MQQEKQYYAFISYKREDEAWAKWLAKKIENYNLPTTLNGKELPKSLRPVFRDTDELSAGNLPKQIYDALYISQNLVVVCSPRSAHSEWVNKEIEDFVSIKGGRTDSIFPFIIEGTPYAKDSNNECFPEALRCLPGNEERLGGNINEQGGRDAAVVKVISGMLGVSFDSLWQKQERALKRKRFAIVIVSLLFAFLCLSIGGYIAMQNREIKEKNTKLEINNLSLKLYLIELDINKGDNIQSLVDIKLIKNKYEDIIYRFGMIEKINELENLCITNIKRYPLKIKSIFIDDVTEITRVQDYETLTDSTFCYQVYKSDTCDITYDYQESEIQIYNKFHNNDTSFYVFSKFIITQDKKYLVFSDGGSSLFFYDIINNEFINKYNSEDLYVAYPSLGGVIDVSYDNTHILYHSVSRGHEESFIIDLLNNKKIIDNIPSSFPRLSPNGKYLLSKNYNSVIVTSVLLNKELCNINDSIFSNVIWCEDNTIKASNGKITTLWEINEEETLDYIEFDPNLNKGNILYAECSNDGKYLAVITDTYLYVWDIILGINICRHAHDVYYPNCLVFSEDSKKIAYVGIHGSAELYNIIDKSCKSLWLADVNSNSGDKFILDFLFNDEILMTSTYDKLNFCNSVYSLIYDSLILENHKIVAIDDKSIFFDKSEYDSDGVCIIPNSNLDSMLVYTSDTKIIQPFVSAEIIHSKDDCPYYLYRPTWLEFDEYGQICENKLDSTVMFDGEWYKADVSSDSINIATRYVCDSIYKIDIINNRIFITKQNILDNFIVE